VGMEDRPLITESDCTSIISKLKIEPLVCNQRSPWRNKEAAASPAGPQMNSVNREGNIVAHTLDKFNRGVVCWCYAQCSPGLCSGNDPA
jgi:hypothetical protein